MLVHVLFVLFVIFGSLLVLRRPWIVWLHAPALAWGAIVEIGGMVCPLTPLESRLRVLGGESAGFPLSLAADPSVSRLRQSRSPNHNGRLADSPEPRPLFLGMDTSAS